MQRLLLALATGAGLAACGGGDPSPARGPEFPAFTSSVVDQAGLLPAEREAALRERTLAVRRDSGIEYVVVTVPTLQGYPILEYGVDLGRQWRVGGATGKGVLLIVAPEERRVRIEVGKAAEPRVTDPFAAKVIAEQALPNFRAGRFPEGIEAASNAIMNRLRSKATDAEIARQDGVVT